MKYVNLFVTMGVILLILLTVGCTNNSQQHGNVSSVNETSVNEKSVNENIDVDNLGYPSLKSLGIPIKCTATNESTNSRVLLYIKGDKYHFEIINATGKVIEIIVKDNKGYLRNLNPQPGMEDCDWVVNDGPYIQRGPWRISPVDIPDSDFIKQYECVKDDFSDDAFDTPGKVCEYAQVMEKTKND